MAGRPTVSDLIDGVLASDRSLLARAITLVESKAPRHLKDKEKLIEHVLPHSGGAIRIGLSGIPGVGKSTFIETFGLQLLEAGRRVAVLAVDPTSGRTGGSILGDKTRMEQLSVDRRAFIRPSPSGGMLGGVARATQESILILEAAGFDTILVETVGTGQSETMVADMVDLFLVLMLPGAGDDLQGIKKGIIERADMIAVNKADINSDKLSNAVKDYKSALHILQDFDPSWHPPVLPISGLTGQGLDALWEAVLKHQRITSESGSKDQRRRDQQLLWFRRMYKDGVLARVLEGPERAALIKSLEQKVLAGQLTPGAATQEILSALIGD